MVPTFIHFLYSMISVWVDCSNSTLIKFLIYFMACFIICILNEYYKIAYMIKPSNALGI